MTQEDKSLLLKDLCGRLYCGVICQIYDDKYGYKLLGIDGDVLHIDCPVYDEGDGYVEIDYCKPYLRPMSSMTEGEANEFEQITDNLLDNGTSEEIWNTVIDWLNAHHFDHRGLIGKGLAIEVTKENNPYKS